MIYAALIAAAASLIGAALASGDNAKAQAIRMKLAQDIQDIPLPQLDKLVAQLLPPDAAARYDKVTQSTQAESDVLKRYGDEVSNRGETPQDRAAYLRMRNEAGGIAGSAEGAVQRQMANRGLEGSGMSAALQEQGAQAAANSANAAGVNEASAANNRYMTALGQMGDLSSKMRGQELQALSAQDAINEFNARQQSASDLYNARLPQQNFENALGKQNSVAAAQNGVAAGWEKQGQEANQTAGGIAQGAITIGTAYDQYGNPIPKKPDYGASAGAA